MYRIFIIYFNILSFKSEYLRLFNWIMNLVYLFSIFSMLLYIALANDCQYINEVLLNVPKDNDCCKMDEITCNDNGRITKM